MIFVILNILFGIAFLWFAMFSDQKNENGEKKFVVNLSLNTTIICFISAIVLMISFFGNKQLTHVLTCVLFLAIIWLSINFEVCCFSFGKKTFSKNSKIFSALYQIIVIVSAFCFFVIEDISIGTFLVSSKDGLTVSSKPFPFLDIESFQVFKLIYFYFLPGLGVLSLLGKLRSNINKIMKQQLIFLIIAVISFLAILQILFVASDKINGMYDFLFTFAICVFILLLYWITSLNISFDFQGVVSSLASFTYKFLIPSILAGVAFSIILHKYTEITLTSVLLYTAIVYVILAVTYYFTKVIKKLSKSRDTDYSKKFEDELASLDYNESIPEVTEKLARILKENTETTSIDVLIESDGKTLKTVFSSAEREWVLPLDNPIFDVVLNASHPIIFRNHIDSHHSLVGVKDELLTVFDKAQADAMIILHEGRHTFGVIFLGPKRLNGVFDAFDYQIFQNLYSYFFVVGYYMQNIANESVIGTVSRELQFSGQIIQSIQENIDRISNPKVDVGYISVSAHNLGGEFIDCIRLTDDRYIMVIGDMSGKGINASMCMVILKSLIRTFLAETKDFKELVQKVNYFIRMNLPKGTFFAGLFALVDFSDNTMYYINCGIPVLYMYNQAYNNVIEIQGDGRVLGFVKNVEKLVRVKKVKLNPGDIVLACTDGLIDSQSLRGEAFGKARVQKSILENLSYPADRIAQFLHKGLLDFTSKELEDDLSVIVMKCLTK